jgi:CRISPR-associated protein Cas1
MTVLYVKEQGAVIGRDVERIKVTLPAKAQAGKGQAENGQPAAQVVKKISIRELEQVVLYGNVQVTAQAVALLLDHEIDVVFLSEFGKYRGRLGKDGSKFARLRHAQLKLSGDGKRSLAVAGALMRTKLTNQSNLLNDLAQGAARQHAAPLTEAARAIAKLRQESARARDPDTLRGFEGKAAVHYFGAFKALLHPQWGFGGRAYYPPPDPFNALLSFGYGLLQKDLHTVAQLVGLDPYIGCFHALEYGRPSLVLDLMEEFRPLVVDRTMLALALAGQVTPEDFTFTGRPERPVELGEQKLPAIIQAYEERLETVVQHTASRTQQKLRRCLELQARIYARVVLENRAAYEGQEG